MAKELTETEKRLISLMRRINDEQLDDMKGFINFLLAKEKNHESTQNAIKEWTDISPYWKKREEQQHE
jgi:hypothetical protein